MEEVDLLNTNDSFHIHKQPIIALYFESENELFYKDWFFIIIIFAALILKKLTQIDNSYIYGSKFVFEIDLVANYLPFD